MKRKINIRFLSFALSVLMVCTALPAPILMAAEPETDISETETEAEPEIVITLGSAEDFLAFADNCSIDSWSVNKRIILSDDISLSGTDFETIPVFAGTFDGQGHTISGFRSTQQGYIAGLFRYIEKGGTVQNLTLKGNVTGENEKNCIGGLCGINFGTIKNCNFQGNVSGRNTVGGITALNEASGIVTHCSVSGHISGYYTTGGVAGENHGVITYCTNRSDINDDTAWVEAEDEIGTGIFFSISISDDETELYSGVDTGGIAGYSNGFISNCYNYGTVGYEHTGYNIGGIAGRQSGIVSLCSNSGKIYGRKDVGGIVGQMEPYIEVDEAESLRNAVNKLHDLIDKTLTDYQAGKDLVKADFDNLNTYGDGVLESGAALADQMTEFTNDNIEQFQNIAERIEYIVEMLPDVMDSISYAGDSFSRVNQIMGQLAEDLDISGKIDDKAYDETDYNRITLLSSVGGQLACDNSYPAAGETVTITVMPEKGYQLDGSLMVMTASGESIVIDDSSANADGSGGYTFTMTEENVKVEAYFKSKDSSESGIQIILHSNLSGNATCSVSGDGTATLTVTPDTLYVLDGNPEVKDGSNNPLALSRVSGDSYRYTFSTTEDTTSPITVEIKFKKQNQKEVISSSTEDLKASLDKLQSASGKADQIMDRMNDILTDDNGQPREWKDLSPSEQQEMTDLTLELVGYLGEMSSAASSMLSDLGVVSNILSPYISDAASAARDDISDATEAVQEMLSHLKSATGGIRGMADYVNAQPGIVFTPLGEEFNQSREELHEQLIGISDSLKSLNENASDYSDILTEDLRAVNNQFNVVFNLLTNHLVNYGDLNIEDLYEEVSDEDIDSITTGRVDTCTNLGIVKGDINIGGVAGSMSVDEEDPEDSAAGNVDYGIGQRFITKCIINACVNKGYVTAKKDGAGGVVGYMKHGIVLDSEGYGSVESTEGDYVGGICGESHTIIKHCYALCSVSGGKNIGGIAGYAETLQNCYAMSDVKSLTGKTGAIAGQIASYDNMLKDEDTDEPPKVSGNYYVGDDLYGIDNISYIGIAEPVTYRELLTVENLPYEFWHLKVVYRIEDTYLDTQEIKYGESLAGLTYPQIPEKEGFYGVWPDYSNEFMKGNLVIEGEYRNNVTVVESRDGDSQKPYALVEQTFTEDTVLNVTVSDIIPPPKEATGQPCIIYDISLQNSGISGTDSFPIRLLNPYKKSEVWTLTEGKWTKQEYKERGGYLQVNMTGTAQTFCIVDRTSNLWSVVIAVIGGIVLLIALTSLGIHLFKRKK